MNWEDVVRQLRDQFFIPELHVGENGRFFMSVSADRRIAGETADADYLVYAYDPVPYDGPRRLMRAWKNAYSDHKLAYPVQTALYENNNQLFLIAVIRLPELECNIHALCTAIKNVSQWLDDSCSE